MFPITLKRWRAVVPRALGTETSSASVSRETLGKLPPATLTHKKGWWVSSLTHEEHGSHDSKKKLSKLPSGWLLHGDITGLNEIMNEEAIFQL